MYIKNMNSTDMPYILKIQDECYMEVEPESEESLSAKIVASPRSCFVAEDERGGIVGYVISHAILATEPPVLNASRVDIPLSPDALYIHDIAITRVARGAGVANKLISAVIDYAKEVKLPKVLLIAVQGTAPFWQKHGFCVVKNLEINLAKKIRSYGRADYMEYYLNNKQ